MKTTRGTMIHWVMTAGLLSAASRPEDYAALSPGYSTGLCPALCRFFGVPRPPISHCRTPRAIIQNGLIHT